jgi:predicted Co/Zn/Cd cation transporter (cation efflux family)
LIVLWQAVGVIFAWVLTVSGIFSGSLYVPFDNEFINVDTDKGSFGLAVSIYILLSVLFTVLTYLNYRKLNRSNAK